MSKRKGTRNEHKSIRLLESLGYVCTKAGGSLGVWDIIAISPKDILLCQIKTNRTAPPHEREQMQMFQAPKCCVRKQLWIWNDYARNPIVKEIA